jgi:anthranilate synthase component 1
LPPFTSGAVGYAGYDVVRYTEQLPHAPLDDRQLPDLSFAFYDHMVVFDNITKTITVVAMARVEDESEGGGRDLRAAYADAQERVDATVARLSRHAGELAPVDIDLAGEPSIAYRSNFQQSEFEAAVGKCVEYIRAGDIFQVVISQRLALDVHAPPFEIYRTLR